MLFVGVVPDLGAGHEVAPECDLGFIFNVGRFGFLHDSRKLGYQSGVRVYFAGQGIRWPPFDRGGAIPSPPWRV